MQLSDFDFDLPEDLIALRPARPRSSARLLVAQGAADGGTTADASVADLPSYLRPGDRLVLNDTRVIPARLFGQRTRTAGPDGPGGIVQIEVTLLERRDDGVWSTLSKPLRKWRHGEAVAFGAGLIGTLVGRDDEKALVGFNLSGAAFDAALAEAGTMPLPPYIAGRRPADAADHDDYQTIWAAHPGAIAAPTASLHFDAALMAALTARGVAFSHVTLHVGAGTFLPVKVDDINQHKMHAEWGEVSAQAAAEIAQTRAAGGRVIAVGTTALRLIESAATGGAIAPWRGDTDIFIRPGFHFAVADGLMTNFHLPKSTLMMLVSALMGVDRIRALYAHAIAKRYRFYSYGDASLLLPTPGEPPEFQSSR